ASAIATYRDSRVRLATPVQRALDNLPPASGTMVGVPGTVALLGPCVVVVAGDSPLGVVAEACLPAVGGAILPADRDADAVGVPLEARAYGAVAMLRASAVGDEPAILVVGDDAAADALGLPRLT